jgi:hypothetical protein
VEAPLPFLEAAPALRAGFPDRRRFDLFGISSVSLCNERQVSLCKAQTFAVETSETLLQRDVRHESIFGNSA